jgi:exodeoxyribonuclease-3
MGDILPDGQVYWNPAERPGYSGVATFCRETPLEVQMGLEEPRFDVEGRVIRTVYPDFTLFNVYFPNGQRGHERVTYKLDFYARLLEICDQLHAQGKPVIITGDFNTAHRPIDLTNPRQNATTSGFLPEERVWIDYYLAHGFVDAFRDLYPEKIQYTWWTYRSGARARNVGWRLDYFLVSSNLMPRVTNVQVHDDLDGSDHCPVTLYLQDRL